MNRLSSFTVSLLLLGSSVCLAQQNPSPSLPRVAESNLPIVFEPTAGPVPDGVSMIGRAGGMTAEFRAKGFTVAVEGKRPERYDVEFSGPQPTLEASAAYPQATS